MPDPDYGTMIGSAEGLTAMRKGLGLTQGQLAKLLGLDPGTLSRWERGAQNIANPNLLGYALLGVAAREVAIADSWRGNTDEVLISTSFVEALTVLRRLAGLAGIRVAMPTEEVAAS